MRAVLALALVAALAGDALADAAAPSPVIQAKIYAASETYKIVEAQYGSGMAQIESVYQWSARWYNASREAGSTTAAAEHLKRMQSLEENAKKKLAAGLASGADAAASRYYRAEAEQWAAGKSR